MNKKKWNYLFWLSLLVTYPLAYFVLLIDGNIQHNTPITKLSMIQLILLITFTISGVFTIFAMVKSRRNT